MAHTDIQTAAENLMSAREIRELWELDGRVAYPRQVAFQRMSSPAFILAVPVAAVIGGVKFYNRADVEAYTKAKKANWR